MTSGAHVRRRWLLVVAFAIGMAWVEAATVYDLRVMVDRVNPYQADPLPISGVLGRVELVREAATLVMLLTLGALAGRTRRSRLAYSAIAFGVWDLFYYVFLKAISGWPGSLFDWDVLFLLPVPWWGPVLAPACIAVLLLVWGTLASGPGRSRVSSPMAPALWRCNTVGVALALYLFMADALQALPNGIQAMRTVLPDAFNWPLFSVALVLMAAPLAAFRPRTINVSRQWNQEDPVHPECSTKTSARSRWFFRKESYRQSRRRGARVA
jgi:hypothetical protein